MKDLIKKYREKGFRITPQRLAIFEYLQGNTTHPTVEDIYREIKKRYPAISLATVYNTIQALKDRGEVMELTIDPDRKHYDPDTTPHHHVICTECNRIGDVFVDYSPHLKLPEDVLEEFVVVDNQVNFYGICKDCQDKTKDDKTTKGGVR